MSAHKPSLAALDVFRGLAAVAMVFNHAGFALLSKHDAAQGVSGLLVFAGSFAPVLFFFATGFGLGLRRPGAGDSVLAKVVLLVLGDQLLVWSRGEPWGIDFFGFIALSTLIVAWLARRENGERLALIAIVAVLAARFVVSPLLKDLIVAPGILAFLTGARPQDHISFPIGPWLVFPLAGFVLSRAFAARRSSPADDQSTGSRRRTMLAMFGCVVGGAVAAWLLAGRGPSAFFRWGSMGIGYFALSVAVLGAAGMLSVAVVSFPRALSGAVQLRGVTAFLVVPLHYALVRVLESIGVAEVAPVFYVVLATLVTMVSFWLATRLAAYFQQPSSLVQRAGFAVQAALIGVCGLVALISFGQAPLLAFAAAMVGQVFTAASLGRRTSVPQALPTTASL